MRDCEIRIRTTGDKLKWKITPIPNNSPMSRQELERTSYILDAIRISTLERKEKKYPTSFEQNASINSILSKMKT